MHPVYRGVARQYGGGLGSLFKSMIKKVIPFVQPKLQSAANVLKHQGIKQGLGAVQDIVQKGQSPKQVLKRRAQSLGEALLQDIKGPSPKRPRHSTPTPHRRKIKKRTVVKKRRPLDIFD